ARSAMAGGARGRGCEAAAASAGTLRPGPEPQPHSQRTRHAPATAEATMGAAQAALRDAPQTRGLAHEARRRTRQVAGGLAPGRYRACCAGGRVRLRAFLMPTTLYRLAAKSTPKEVIDTVIDCVESREIVLDNAIT